ncbi:MAG: DUF3048 domain-containing protein [Candidatus Shapirobacteria bacterium]
MKKIFNLEKRHWLLLFGVYLFAGGVSFSAFSFWQKEAGLISSPLVEQEIGSDGEVVFAGPKDQECPINGVMYTAGEKEIWDQRRPMAVMIENHEDSRPQSGLFRADIIYEAVAEGGITRFMGVYYCAAAVPVKEKYDLGPVRSSRIYFLDWALEYGANPLYVHVGGAGLCSDVTVDNRAKALCQIEKLGWKDAGSWNDMDQFALPYTACRREPERTGQSRATEHTMYCNSQFLWDYADEQRGLPGWQEANTFQSWEFKEDKPVSDSDRIGNISFDFWQGYKDYSVHWAYDAQNNVYLREDGGQPHIDFLANSQLEAKAIVIQFTKETGPVDDHKHLLYATIGSGKALVFQDGGATEGKWAKKDQESRTIFSDLKGKEIAFDRGQIWIEVLPLGNTVDYD